MQKSKQKAVFTILFSWLCVVVIGFWFFSLQYLHSFQEYWVTFSGDLNLTNKANGQITMYHLIDKECPCTRFSLPHISQLQEKYQGVSHQFIYKDVVSELEGQFISNLREMIPASPAVVIFSRDGELSYFGPYSSGAVCGQGRDITEVIIQSLNQDVNPSWINQEAVGCLCQWQQLNS